MPLVLGDSFEIFDEFDISKKYVIATYSKPDRLESLSNNVRLFLKAFKRDNERRRLLLVGIQNVNNEELLAFSYWIPATYKTLKGSLLDLLEVFVNQFGFRIRIGNSEGYLLRYSERLIYGKLKNPNDLIEVLVPDQVPCQYFLFTSENLAETINKVSIYYAFAINTGKYIFWVNSDPNISLKVKSGWYDFVKTNFVDYIQPHGQTKISIHKQKTTDKLEIDPSKQFSTIEIPKIYENQFRHILQIINKLKNNEKIIFRLSFEKPQCLFCQSEDISKEHIFPIWIRPYLTETTFQGTQFTNYGDEPLKKIMESATSPGKKESSHGYTAKLVCNDCNNTWMSKLENDAKKILVQKNNLVNTVDEKISRSDAFTLSHWLIVKALLLSNKVFSNIHQFNKKLFEDLKFSEIPKGFIVETTIAHNPKFDFNVGKGLLQNDLLRLKKIPFEKGKEMASNFFTCSIQLNHLLFRISYLDPTIPLKRVTSIKKTIKLHLYNEDIYYQQIEGEEELWKKVVKDNLELHLFALGLILTD